MSKFNYGDGYRQGFNAGMETATKLIFNIVKELAEWEIRNDSQAKRKNRNQN